MNWRYSDCQFSSTATPNSDRDQVAPQREPRISVPRLILVEVGVAGERLEPQGDCEQSEENASERPLSVTKRRIQLCERPISVASTSPAAMTSR